MNSYSIVQIFISFLSLINGHSSTEDEFLAEFVFKPRSANSAFDAHFQRGQCPENFYQSDGQCVFFSTDQATFSWYQVEHLCSGQVSKLVNRASRSMKEIRPLIINTAHKKQILEILYEEYEEDQYAVRLSSDYHILQRCQDERADDWPQPCDPTVSLNDSICVETRGYTEKHICLNPVDCHQRRLRVACEFTLSGNTPLNGSTFRTCPKVEKHDPQFSVWAWILIGVGAMLLLLLILGGILAFLRNSRSTLIQPKSSISEDRTIDQQIIKTSSRKQEPAGESMIARSSSTNRSNSIPVENQQQRRVSSSLNTAK